MLLIKFRWQPVFCPGLQCTVASVALEQAAWLQKPPSHVLRGSTREVLEPACATPSKPSRLRHPVPELKARPARPVEHPAEMLQ